MSNWPGDLHFYVRSQLLCLTNSPLAACGGGCRPAIGAVLRMSQGH